jgi:hypothetical protein
MAGQYIDISSQYHGLIEHWNGQKWVEVPVPNP